MTVNANCNIIKVVKELIDRKKFGLRDKLRELEIKEYIAKLYFHINNCIQLDCVEESEVCVETFTKVCSFSIPSLTLTFVESTEDINNGLLICVDTNNFSNGVAPFTYNWGFDNTMLDIYPETIPESCLTLVWKSGNQLDTSISLEVIDSEGCISNIQTYQLIN